MEARRVFAQAAISGLRAALRTRHDAERSVGKTAATLAAREYAMSGTSSSLHCAAQFVASQFERKALLSCN